MHPRYVNPAIRKLWLPGSIYASWQQVELEVIRTRENLDKLPAGTYRAIKNTLDRQSIDEAWLEEHERETNHDLFAFLDERRRHLPPELQHVFHEGMTSYDTEEPARAFMLQESAKVIQGIGREVLSELRRLACEHRYTPMLGVTHGQWAGIMSFGVRCAKWHMCLHMALARLRKAMEETAVAKLSGAFGTYSEEITAKVEADTLRELGLRAFEGATQIVPRYVWIPLAQATLNVAEVMGNIAETLRLGARSGYQITQEPFGKKQKGSSAMPHKRNPITWEKVIGMVELARGYASQLQSVCVTWEERDIRESALERNAWPDLFHATAHALGCMKRTLAGLVVNKDAMLRQIRDARGTYATDLAKGWLAENLAGVNVPEPAEMAYRILQQASSQTFPRFEAETRPTTLSHVDLLYGEYCRWTGDMERSGIMEIVAQQRLSRSESLDAAMANLYLGRVFVRQGALAEWTDFFRISRHLEKEEAVFRALDTITWLP